MRQPSLPLSPPLSRSVLSDLNTIRACTQDDMRHPELKLLQSPPMHWRAAHSLPSSLLSVCSRHHCRIHARARARTHTHTHTHRNAASACRREYYGLSLKRCGEFAEAERAYNSGLSHLERGARVEVRTRTRTHPHTAPQPPRAHTAHAGGTYT